MYYRPNCSSWLILYYPIFLFLYFTGQDTVSIPLSTLEGQKMILIATPKSSKLEACGGSQEATKIRYFGF